jgi:hypothetical protein
MKYIVLTPVRQGRDKEKLQAGESISLSEKDAVGLLACDAIAKPSDPRAVDAVTKRKEATETAEAADKLMREARAASDKIRQEAEEKAQADAKLDAEAKAKAAAAGQSSAAPDSDPTALPAGTPGGAVFPPTMADGSGSGDADKPADTNPTALPAGTPGGAPL